MSQIESIIRYDGPALVGHDMDIEELAPALLALASLIQAANHKFNGDRSAVKVTVNADIEQQCFQIKIKVVESIIQQAKNFLDGDMATLKEICEWVGIIGGSTFTLFKLLVALTRKAPDSTTYKADASDDAVVYQAQKIEQHYHFHLPPDTPEPVRQLVQDPAIVAKAQQVLKPATKNGYDTAGFYEPSGKQVFSANKAEAKAVLSLPPLQAPVAAEVKDRPDDDEHSKITARVLVKTQRNEGRAQWELKWAARAEWATIDDLEWLDRFQSGKIALHIPFYLDVELDMITSRTNPDAAARFHVLKVLNDQIPTGGGVQGDLLDDKPA